MLTLGKKELPRLWKIVEENNTVFAAENLELTQTSLVRYEIDTSNTAPIHSSDTAYQVVLVKKKECPLRRVNYRGLNECTRLDAHPLPAIDVMLQSLQRNRYFKSLDIWQGTTNALVR